MRVIPVLLLSWLFAPPAAGVTPLPVEVVADEPRSGPQWVAADAQGRAVLLDGESRTVRSFKNGVFTDAEALPGSALGHGVIRRAVRSRSGDGWLLFVPPDGLRTLQGDEVERLPPVGWVVNSIGLHGDRPVVSVRPTIPGRVRAPGAGAETAPLLLSFSGDGWDPFFERDDLPVDPDGVDLDSAMLFATDSQRNLWAVHQYRYRAYRFSPTGKLRFLLAVEGGEPARDEADDEERAAARRALAEEARARGLSLEGATLTPVTAKPTINGVVVGRDGNVYFFLPRGLDGKPALDRYNPYTHAVERTGIQLEYRGHVSLAAAREGLLLAGYNVKSGVWLVPWERLETARWQPVEATGDGLPLVSSE
jgi:hypothetical protein